MPTTDIRSLIKAVRQDAYLGKESLSYMDETQTDRELAGLIRGAVGTLRARGSPITKENIIAELTWLENLWREQD